MTDAPPCTRYNGETVALQVHNLGANLIFDGHGLTPYWGLVDAFEPAHASQIGPIEALGREWQLTTSSYWQGQLQDPQGQIDGGLYEYQYQLVCDDGVEDMDLSAQFRPGFPEAVHAETGEPIQGIPTECPESLRVQLETTNLTQAEALALLRALFGVIDLNPDYVGESHEWSRIYSLEAYARLDREVAESQLTGAGGLLEDLAGFASQQGGKGEHKWDHEAIQGHYEAVALDPETWGMLIPGQTLPKRLKCYHPQHPRTETAEGDDPLYHPKLEVQYWAGYDGESLRWDGYDTAIAELEETAVNGLNWAGISVTPDETVFVADAYYDVTSTERAVSVYANPLPELREATTRHAEDELLQASLGDAEFDTLIAIANGGQQHYETIADTADVSTSTVYRLLDKLAAVLESEQGIVDFADRVTRKHVTGIVDRLRETAGWARQSVREVLQNARVLRGDATDPTPLERWLSRHGIALERQHDGLHFRFEGCAFSERELIAILRAGYEAAHRSGLVTGRFLEAVVSWRTPDGDHRREWRAFVQDGREMRILGREPLH